MKYLTLKKTITNKRTQIQFPENSKVSVQFPEEFKGTIMVLTDNAGNQLKTRSSHFFGLFGKKAPSIKILEKWTEDSFCKSLFGQKVEPDGFDPEGSPSILVAMGLI
jgi:hypothetical protein